MKPNILLLEYISKEALVILHKHTNVHEVDSPMAAMAISASLTATTSM